MAFVAIPEKMSYPNCGTDPLDPALHEFEVGVVAEAEFVQPLGLGPTDVTGGGIALRVIRRCGAGTRASQCSSPARSIDSRMSSRVNAMVSLLITLRAGPLASRLLAALSSNAPVSDSGHGGRCQAPDEQ
jgi:hypothetical protein